jgi:hypothetical protein
MLICQEFVENMHIRNIFILRGGIKIFTDIRVHRIQELSLHLHKVKIKGSLGTSVMSSVSTK